MPYTCVEVRMPDGAVALVRMQIKRCQYCTRPHTRLCDYPTETGTCDAPLCGQHARRVGPDRDYCPAHAEGV
jgi:hypothetical protein